MAQGPSLIFDKSSLESLNLDEAVLLDNFYRSAITPLFFVECLADLEKSIKSRSTPEQLVGSLAERTPEGQVCAQVHHTNVLLAELSRQFDLMETLERPLVAGGKPVALGNVKGMFFQRSPEEDALHRWRHHEFLEIERQFAKEWRRALMQLDHAALVKYVMGHIGPWRKPTSLDDAKQLTDLIIDNLDAETLLRFGMDLFGAPQEAQAWVIADWTNNRRPALRAYVPYFVHMLSVNIFFCLVIPTQLLRNVKESHQIDLAYLYYLPFCSVFTSKDRFHIQIVPLFLNPRQTFVNGVELKEDLKRLDDYYSQLPPDVLEKGFYHYALVPPEDTSFLVTRLWDKYLPLWRMHRDMPDLNDPAIQADIMEQVTKFEPDAPGVTGHDEQDLDKLEFVTLARKVRAKRGKWRIFSPELEEQMREGE